ncbi:MAG: hypothetical protein IT208_16170 [Chthonomonadales bacterium]|nr:hypothetical protein [Chthonomonadales bacterium]
MRVVTVRLPDGVHQALRHQSARTRTSLNDMFRTMVERYLREEEERELFEGFERLGQDAEESRAEYAFAAQAEVVLRDE